MSHFTKMKTKLVIKQYLIKALSDLGKEVREGKVMIRGYDGQKTEVEVMFPSGNPGYDIGFVRAGETYDLVADWWGIENIKPEELLSEVQQRYAYHAVITSMSEQGF